MEGMVDQLKLKVIDTLTTTLESARKHAEVVEVKVVNCETNLVECPLVEKDVGVLRVAVDSCDMNLVDCLVVRKENSKPKHFTFTETEPSTMEHLVNACAFHTEKMGLKGEDKQIANENSDFDTLLKLQMIKASKVNVVKGDGKLILGKVFENIRRIKKPALLGLDENKTGWMLDDHLNVWIDLLWRFRPGNADWSIVGPHFCSSILSDQMPLFYASNKRYPVPWSDVEKVYIPLNNTKTYWALAELELRTSVITIYDSMTPRKRNKKLPIQENKDCG
nr:phospholipase-like protein [Tanacetum cinerariifolium]